MSYLARRDDADPERIGGLGLSVNGELLMQTAARDRRLRDQLQITGAPRRCADFRR